MMQAKILFFIPMTLMILSCICFAAGDYSIGMSPTSLFLGEIEPGTSKLGTFRLLTPSTEELLVYMEKYDAGIELSANKFPDYITNISEEECSSWMSFVRNPVEIELMEGEQRNWKDVDFFIHVPKDAEAGYHFIAVRPSLQNPEESMGDAGSRVVGVTSFVLAFSVEGDAKREGIILDVLKTRQTENQMEVSTYFQNTGDLTVYARASHMLEDSGKSFDSAIEKVAPGEIRQLKSFIPISEFAENREQEITTYVDYATGNVSAFSTLSIEGAVIEGKKYEPGAGIPILYIIAIIIALSAVFTFMYKRRL